MSPVRHDPTRTVHDALERAGCDPRGPGHKFAARCPAHDDRNASLSVGTGADGRALIRCHAGCPADTIVAALDLAWPDLFPAGHRHARPIRGVGKSIPALELVLRALAEIHIPYRATRNPEMWVAELCPLCLDSTRWPLFIVEDNRRQITLSCTGGCNQTDILNRIVGAEPVTA
jgi:hypothetical protein